MTAEIPYRLIRSGRTTCVLQVQPDGAVIVRAPMRMPEREIWAFVRQKADWIRRVQLKMCTLRSEPAGGTLTAEQLRQMTADAARDLSERVRRLAPLIGVTYGRITIRHQKTRWGSCSSAGNLNFNCLLMEAPPDVRDYIVVHELCHRREMNHSARFWTEVARVMPNYAAEIRWLRENGGALIRRLPNAAV